MFDLMLNQAAPARRAAPYLGPERRAGAPPGQASIALYASMLDEVDYGLLLLSPAGQVLHANHAARTELDEQHPLRRLGGMLGARLGRDVLPLHDALAAAQRGLRHLLTLGEGEQRVSVAVVPLAASPGATGQATLVVLGKRQMCEGLSVQWFARGHALTQTETRVLEALCAGIAPTRIAKQHGVGMATVRTQIGSIRNKTGSASIRDLVRMVAVLPPLVSALRDPSRVPAQHWAQAA